MHARRQFVALLTTVVAAALLVALVWSVPCSAPRYRARPLARASRQPDDFPLQTGIYEHQNWIEFAVPESDATTFVLCLDGRLFSAGEGHTPQRGAVRVSVETTWVNV